jgi:hypothetical protein
MRQKLTNIIVEISLAPRFAFTFRNLSRPADKLMSSAYAGASLKITTNLLFKFVVAWRCASSPAIPIVLIRLFWRRLPVLGM